MLLLTTALHAIHQALDVLNVNAPGLPPGHDHWLEARLHLTIAAREIGHAIEHALLAHSSDREM